MLMRSGRIDGSYPIPNKPSLPYIISIVPPLLPDYLLTSYLNRKQGMSTLSLVNKEVRRIAMLSVTSFKVDLRRSDFGCLAALLNSSKSLPQQLQLTLACAPRNRLANMLKAYGPSVVGSITHLHLVADGFGNCGLDELKAVARAAVPILLAAMPGLRRVTLTADPLFESPIISALAGLQQLTHVIITSPFPLGCHIAPILRNLQTCSTNLKNLAFRFHLRDLATISEQGLCTLPSSITELGWHGRLSGDSEQLISSGFLSNVRSLTVRQLDTPFNNLSMLMQFAPSLERLTVTEGVTELNGTAWVREGFLLNSSSISLCGSATSIRAMLGHFELQGVESCSINYSCTALDLDKDSCLELVVSKCPGLTLFTCKIVNLDGNTISGGLMANGGGGRYAGAGDFLKPLVGCLSLSYLRLLFALPAATREGLHSLLSSLPSVSRFTLYPSLMVNYHRLGRDLECTGRAIEIDHFVGE